MKELFKYGLIIFLLPLFWNCDFQNNRRLPSLSESYRKTDKLPFGSYIAYKRFQAQFSGYWINVVDKPFNKTWNAIRDFSTSKYSIYFIITKNLLLSEKEVYSMMEYVRDGNDLFISADYIDPKLLDALNCSVNRNDEMMIEMRGKMRDTHVGLFFGKNLHSSEYGYYYFPFLNYIGYDTASARVLGVNENDLPDYIVLFSGKGRVYLHVAPRAFSNYFLLTENNFKYFQYVTAYLRLEPQYIYWDEYYKNASSSRHKNNFSHNESYSSLSVIMSHPSLKWAFWIALVGILLFVLFNMKRKQRLIPTIIPNKNTTVLFAETIGRLYLQRKNNKKISEKMITYFYEYLRRKYFINTSVINQELLNSLSGKSGISSEETKYLFDLIEKINQQENVSDEVLRELNSKIENFKR